ncbi:Endoglucanase [Dactylella cylindrospora]|nr:Endoglucanase [Dactylella cylindrospora]
MKSDIVLFAALAGLVQQASAQAQGYGQCGGVQWTGPTSCVSGWTCTYSNPYYSQCLPGSSGGGGNTVTVTVTSFSTRVVTTTSVSTNWVYETVTETVTENGGPCTTDEPQPTGCDADRTFDLLGVNQAGPEFGEAIPGELGTDYTWPNFDSIQYFIDKGFNAFRVPIKLERVAPPSSGLLDPSTYDQAYLVGLYQTISYITNSGAKAIIDVHNFGRYDGQILDNVEGFGNFWQAISSWTNFNDRVIFDLMNEYHDMDNGLIFQLNQAGISAIRSNDIENLILVEGNAWSGAWHWVDNNDMLKYLTDIKGNMAFEMHQYLDEDGSGTSEECVSDTVGAERVESATRWCEDNGVRCFLGEFGAGPNDQCEAAVNGLLCALRSSSAWIGATWWAAGPWWPSDYFQSIEPPNGRAVERYVPLLESYL